MLKKTIIIFLLFIPLALEAQGLKFSLLAEPQFSWMITDKKDITSKGAIMGLNAGLGMDFYFAENYAFATGVSINNVGGKLEYDTSITFNLTPDDITVPPTSEITYLLRYINIPLGLKFKTNEIGYSTFFANLGVTPMINIRNRATDISETLYKEDISEDIEAFNMNYFISMGIQYSLGGSTALIGGLGYSSGFMDVTSDPFDKITLNTFSVRLGILF